jgi:hypothetical protein
MHALQFQMQILFMPMSCQQKQHLGRGFLNLLLSVLLSLEQNFYPILFYLHYFHPFKIPLFILILNKFYITYQFNNKYIQNR